LVRFGMREATSELNATGGRVFKINGRPVLVRGGGWAPDMFLRSSAEREKQEIAYVKDMNLNAIRFEGKTESGRFLELVRSGRDHGHRRLVLLRFLGKMAAMERRRLRHPPNPCATRRGAFAIIHA
jgi:hypothetical protein